MTKVTNRPFKQAHFIIESEIYRRFRVLGNERDISLQDMHRQAILDYLEKYGGESRPDGE